MAHCAKMGFSVALPVLLTAFKLFHCNKPSTHLPCSNVRQVNKVAFVIFVVFFLSLSRCSNTLKRIMTASYKLLTYCQQMFCQKHQNTALNPTSYYMHEVCNYSGAFTHRSSCKVSVIIFRFGTKL